MNIVGLNIAEAFCRRHSDARGWMENWLADAEAASWKTPQDIKGSYSSASFLAESVVILGDRRCVQEWGRCFDMGWNTRRLRRAESQAAPQELSMVIRIIKSKAQHRAALEEVTRLARLDPAPESEGGLRLELLTKLVEDYETARFVFAKPDPIDAVLFRMKERGLRQKDLAKVLGGKNRASEVLARRRPLTLSMIRALHEKLDIPPALLISEPAGVYRVRRAANKSVRAVGRIAK